MMIHGPDNPSPRAPVAHTGSGGPPRFALGAATEAFQALLQQWDVSHVVERAWRSDVSLWRAAPPSDVEERMGWLHLPERMRACVPDLTDLAEEVRREGTTHIVLLGMGGSSLAPKVFPGVFGARKGYPGLLVLDSTHPGVIQGVIDRIDIPRTLFLVSSKSGTTLEPLSFQRLFWQRVREAGLVPGDRFVAITDPGTPLADLAAKEGFRRTFPTLPTVGGRYSALTYFGLVPAALIGVDLDRLLRRAQALAEACLPSVPIAENPGASLGAALGLLATQGKDKLTIYASGRIAAFPVWLEQLLAESTGKEGRGIVPVVYEPPAPLETYGRDRVFVHLHEEEGRSEFSDHLERLEGAGHPVIEIRTPDPGDLGPEFFRWEMAVALSGIMIGIDPFDQPDVEMAKQLAREAMDHAGQETLAPRVPTVGTEDPAHLASEIRKWLGSAKAGDYIGIQAYLAETPTLTASLAELRHRFLTGGKVATTFGYGPSFLHSTGQLHKGGPPTGLFLQLVDTPARDLQVPGEPYTFGEIIRAQAIGDYRALVAKHRRVLRVDLGPDAEAGLRRLLEGARSGMRT